MSVMYDEYMRFVVENFNITDDNTRKHVLSEDTKSQAVQHLTSKLYDNIVNKIDEIDFGTIPFSKGDITKIENYEELVDCINIISKIVVEYGEDSSMVNVVSTAIDNIKLRTRKFEKAYALNIEYPIVVYNLITLSCVASVSFLIASCIEFIKSPDNSFVMSLDKAGYRNSKNYLIFRSLSDFNESCRKGYVDTAIDSCISLNKKVFASESTLMESPGIIINTIKSAPTIIKVGIGLGAAAGLFAVGKNIRPWLRDITYILNDMKQNMSDYFNMISETLKLNASNLEYRDTYKNKDDVYRKQLKLADTFKRLSDKFQVKVKQSNKISNTRIISDDKIKYTISDNPDGSITLF